MNSIQGASFPARSPTRTRTTGAADDRTGGSDGKGLRQAAVVIPLSAAGEGQEGIFVDRDEQIDAILARLDPGQHSSAVTVSVISGLPGVGKTAFTRKVAAQALSNGWFSSAIFADLHGYDPELQVFPEQLFSTILRALGVGPDDIPILPGEQATVYHMTLASMAKANERVLLLLDNASDSAQVSGLLPQPLAHRVLITSRNRLADLTAKHFELGIFPPTEAVGMLAEILQLADPEDRRISRCPQDAEKLAQLCGYLPLALRISGGLLAEEPTQPLAHLVKDLETHPPDDVLTIGSLSLSATFERSWQGLLERDERAAQLFMQLPINPGSEISTEAAAALAAQSEYDTSKLLHVLQSWHLIEAGTAYGRWRMHDLLRLYADSVRRRYTSYDNAAAVSRIVGFYLARAEAARDLLLGLPPPQRPAVFASQEEAMAWLDAERPNLTSSVRLAEETRQYKLAVDLALAISVFLRRGRHFDDYLVTATAAVRTAGQVRDPVRAAKAISNLGLAPREVPVIDELLASLHRERDAARAAGDLASQAWALAKLGIALSTRGKVSDVIEVAGEASALFGNIGDRPDQAWALTMLGIQLERAGRTDEAIGSHQRAREIFQQLQDHGGEAWALTNLGASLRAAGRFDEAIRVGDQANGIFRGMEEPDLSGEGASLVNRGMALAGLGRFDDAVPVLEEACSVFRQAGDLQREAGARSGLGVILRDAGRIAEARRHWQLARDVFQETGSDPDAERVSHLLAESDGDSGS